MLLFMSFSVTVTYPNPSNVHGLGMQICVLNEQLPLRHFASEPLNVKCAVLCFAHKPSLIGTQEIKTLCRDHCV